MYARSSTNTPAPPRRRPEQLDSSITWVNDWYIPDSFSVLEGKSIPFNLKLKGWYKTDMDHSSNQFRNFNHDDALDLNKWKYYSEVPIIDHNALSGKDEASGLGEEMKSNLSSVVTFQSDESQISGIGNI